MQNVAAQRLRRAEVTTHECSKYSPLDFAYTELIGIILETKPQNCISVRMLIDVA